ncbi:glycosyltransferase family 2 protein [Streptomyces sp. enrichment culture]|uniref:glycosyltransferase family 2 protein n=1 Tax=Streptomyces sp. enrichment culture TaxID=1795815 RepID=UPI003F56B997
MTVAVVIPWRPGTAERNAHHQTVRDHLTTLLPDALHLDADSGHTPFSRAGSRNEGVRQAESAGADIVILCDADTLVEAEPLHAAIEAAADGVLHLPYTWYRGLSQAGTAAYLKGVPADHCATDWAHQWATGGVLVIQPAAWWTAGGMDEEFTGWGFEDTAFRTAADALLGPTIKHDGTITHLWHPIEAGIGSPLHVAGGQRMQRYVDATGDPVALRNLIGEHATSSP